MAMAAATTGLKVREVVGSRDRAASAGRRRRITPRAGRALEILGHAIDYLIDEYIYEGKTLSTSDPQVAAIQLLMALNREIYHECPVVPTLGERLRSLLGIASL
jgi:hypothetical protein